jgi:hypothetical protein
MQLYSSWSSEYFHIQRKMATFNWCRAHALKVPALPSPPQSPGVPCRHVTHALAAQIPADAVQIVILHIGYAVRLHGNSFSARSAVNLQLKQGCMQQSLNSSQLTHMLITHAKDPSVHVTAPRTIASRCSDARLSEDAMHGV